MQIERLTTSIRPRNQWQAMDLGFQMGRFWFLRLWLLWLMGALPLIALLEIPLHEYPAAVMFAFWWLKPVYELPLLYFLSRAIFGEEPTLKEVARSYWSITRSFLLPLLTWRRFSLTRSFDNPVQMLEGLVGKARRDRKQLLKGEVSDKCQWLMVICYHFEFLLYFSLITLLTQLVPTESSFFTVTNLMFSQSDFVSHIQLLFYVLAASVIAPFYTAAGFSMYLSRRTRLEGWDIELSFKRLANRLKASASPSRGPSQGMAAAIIFAATLIVNPSPTQAETPEGIRAELEQVLDDATFGETRTRTVWRLKDKPVTEEDPVEFPGWLEGLMDSVRTFVEWLANIMVSLAQVFEVLLWIGIAVVIILAVRRFAPWLRWQNLTGSAPRQTSAATGVVFGMDIPEDLLETDISGTVSALLDQGETRAALSLLYRASLARLVHEHQMDISDSSTEGECLRQVASTRPPQEADYFRQLTGCWCRLAYAHEAPADPTLRDLGSRWSSFYGSAP